MTIEVDDRVRTVVDIERDPSGRIIPEGTEGAVLERYEHPEGYTLEVFLPDTTQYTGYSYDVVDVSPGQVVVVEKASKYTATNSSIEQVQAYIAGDRILREIPLHPCSQQEVEALNRFAGCPLPQTYIEFLLLMGKGMGDFFADSQIFYPSMYQLQELARDLLREDDCPEQLPEDAFVFFMHGHRFYYFRASEGDDPYVYGYFDPEDSTELTGVYPYFTLFLRRELYHYAWYKRRGESRSDA